MESGMSGFASIFGGVTDASAVDSTMRLCDFGAFTGRSAGGSYAAKPGVTSSIS
jgi:hypothetical protein